MSRRGKQWTTREMQIVREMAPTNGARTIAAKLGRSQKSVKSFAIRNGISCAKWGADRVRHSDAVVRAVRNMVSMGLTQRVISKGTGVSYGHVYKIASGKRRAGVRP